MPTTQQRVLNKKLSQIFRMRGLQVRPDAMQPLYDVLEGDENWEETLQALMLEVQSQARAPLPALPVGTPSRVDALPGPRSQGPVCRRRSHHQGARRALGALHASRTAAARADERARPESAELRHGATRCAAL
jgi:hypothetical protein